MATRRGERAAPDDRQSVSGRDQTIGRAWGAPGIKANFMAWRTFPTVESELLNVHGLAHKVLADLRDQLPGFRPSLGIDVAMGGDRK